MIATQKKIGNGIDKKSNTMKQTGRGKSIHHNQIAIRVWFFFAMRFLPNLISK